jgi:hypothetical protein
MTKMTVVLKIQQSVILAKMKLRCRFGAKLCDFPVSFPVDLLLP